MKCMYKVAVVGDRDSVLAFRAVGIHVFTCYEAHEARHIVDSIAKDNYGIIFITEQIAQKIPETIERYQNKMVPAIILIPSNQGSLGIGLDHVDKNVEKAVGANIL